MKNIAIIPARGGSKRIPRKNIKPFLGKPIIAYSIEAALGSGVFDEVMVSTDDEEIAAIARKYGAKVPFFRSEKTASDTATTVDVLREVLQTYEEMGQEFDYCMNLYPCAPFVTAQRIKDAMQTLIEKDGDEVLNVVRFSFPPQRAHIIKDGYLFYQYPEYRLWRSQDLEPIYHDCGQFSIFDPAITLGKRESRGKVCPLIVDERFVQDIDNESDWHLAEIKYRRFILGEE